MIDSTALSLCMDNRLPIHVFELAGGNVRRVVAGERVRHDHLDGRGGLMAELDDLLQDAARRMDRSVEATRTEFSSVRTGRAAPALLDRIQIDYYGQRTPLKQMATISAPEPRSLSIQPFDPTQIKAIEKAIPGVGPRAHALERRQADPAADPSVDRGPAQGARQGRPQLRGGGARRRRDVRRRSDAPPEGASSDRRRRRRRGAQGGGARTEAADEHTKAIDEALRHKEAEIMEV